MNLRITGNRVWIKPFDQQDRGGLIIIPDRHRHRDPKTLNQFIVLAVGPGRRLKGGGYDPIPLAPGDRVLASTYLDHQILDDGTRIIPLDKIEMAWR